MKTSTRKILRTFVPNNVIRRRLNRKAGNCILLTFDDGPHPETTPLVLKQLDDYRVRAVFFVVGRFARENPELVNEIADKGHVIGNHTYGHPLGKPPGFFAYRRDIVKCQDAIKGAVGVAPRLCRPPLGLKAPSVLLAAKSAGLKSLFWSCEGSEWTDCKPESAGTIAKKLSGEIRPRDNVLLHDNNPKVPDVLDMILPELQSKGIDMFHGVNFLG